MSVARILSSPGFTTTSKLLGLIIHRRLQPQNPSTLGVTPKAIACARLGRRQTSLNFPNLPIGWAASFIRLWTQSRIILLLGNVLAPAMPIEVARIFRTPTSARSKSTLSHVKAAQESLKLNGQSGLPAILRQPSWNPLNYPLLRKGCFAPPRVQHKGTRFMPRGKSTASPLSGPM